MTELTCARAVVVDDEPLARKVLREMLTDCCAVRVVAEAEDGAQAIAAIVETRPDLVFLDVQMPQLDGFGVLERLDIRPLPTVVFVTAHDRYATRAFDVEALDYVLKPFDAERLERAVDRALTRRRGQAAHECLRQLSMALERPDHLTRAQGTVEATHRSTRLAIPARDGVRFLDATTIDWIEADDKEVCLHIARERISVRLSLAELLRRLDHRDFVRVHRSAVVNLAATLEIQPWFHGDYVILLRSGARVTSGRAYRHTVQRLLRAGDVPTRGRSRRDE